MVQRRRLRLWFASVLVVLLIVAGALWLRGTLPGGQPSPLPTPGPSGESPLLTPVPASATILPPSRTGVGATLLWVALGVLLSLTIAVVILHWHRRTAL